VHRLFQRELEDWPEDAISSQIHQNVCLPEPLMDLGNGTLDFLGLSDIANYGKRLLFPLCWTACSAAAAIPLRCRGKLRVIRSLRIPGRFPAQGHHCTGN
jgi:hypothetical protein